MNVDPVSRIGKRNDIDVVAGIRLGRLHSRRLDQTGESLAVSLDSLVYPISNGDIGAIVRVSLISRRLRLGGRSQG